jgi:hypothetical protein
MQAVWGDEADACYDAGSETLYLDGETPPDGTPMEEVAAHECGHHIAANRSNFPWRAFDWGPKRGATYEGVGQGVVENLMFPGDEDAHYYQNPGEGWAEAYRVANGSATVLELGQLLHAGCSRGGGDQGRRPQPVAGADGRLMRQRRRISRQRGVHADHLQALVGVSGPPRE